MIYKSAIRETNIRSIELNLRTVFWSPPWSRRADHSLGMPDYDPACNWSQPHEVKHCVTAIQLTQGPPSNISRQATAWTKPQPCPPATSIRIC